MKKILFLVFICSLPVFHGLQAKGCWSTHEISIISDYELEDITVISFKDAVSCRPINNARVEFFGRVVYTDENGLIQIESEVISPEDDRDLPFIVLKNGYIPLQTNLEIRMGGVINNLHLMSKELPLNQMRFVLQWGEKPLDLDLHLKSKDFHVSYRNMKNATNAAELDRDALKGYGPETITLKRISTGNTYSVFVHRYSKEGVINELGKVLVYRNNRLDRIIKLPNTNKRYVLILKVVNKQLHYSSQPGSAAEMYRF